MGVTSRKLYNVKNDVLRKNISKIGVNSDDELLLLEAPSEFKEVYRTLGVNSKQDFVDSQLKESREIKIYQDLYKNSEAFKGNHIKRLCNTYDLMVLPISNVRGYLCDNAMKAIKEFTDANKNTVLSDANLYILAGRECFYDEFIGKEVKTFIIFYRDRTNNSTSNGRKLTVDNVVNQIYSSGNDFNSLRIFNQLFLNKRYTTGDGMPRIWSNLLISLILMLSILMAFIGQMIVGTIFLLIYLVAMYLNNSVSEYKNSWNRYPDCHHRYA